MIKAVTEFVKSSKANLKVKFHESVKDTQVLKEFEISHSISSKKELDSFLKSKELSKLEFLKIENIDISIEDTKLLVLNCKNLVGLELDFIKNLSHESILLIAIMLKDLKKITILNSDLQIRSNMILKAAFKDKYNIDTKNPNNFLPKDTKSSYILNCYFDYLRGYNKYPFDCSFLMIVRNLIYNLFSVDILPYKNIPLYNESIKILRDNLLDEYVMSTKYAFKNSPFLYFFFHLSLNGIAKELYRVSIKTLEDPRISIPKKMKKSHIDESEVDDNREMNTQDSIISDLNLPSSNLKLNAASYLLKSALRI